MLFKEVIALKSVIESTNSIGDLTKSETRKENIFADKQSVRQSEFYQAAATGLRPEIMFVIRSVDYNNEPLLEFKNKTYKIIRTFEKDSEFIELVCQGVVNNVAT